MPDALRDAVARMQFALADADPGATAPACGAWTVADVAEHLGGVHLWAATCLATTEFPGWDHPVRARGGQPLSDWYAGCAATLLDALAGVDPATPAWTFEEGNATAAFWRRRQVHETTIHRVDVEQAGGATHEAGVEGVGPALAADGVEEVLTVLMPRTLVRRRQHAPETVIRVPEPVAFVCPDAGRSWTVQLVDGRLHTRTGTQGAVARLTGDAAYTYLALWNRAPRDRFAVTGDEQASSRLLAAELTP
jgi:uncharacterized protein (TIGR03083 family)